MNILQWNVKSLIVRLPTLQYLISYKKCFLTIRLETWLLSSHSIVISDYSSYRSDRQDGYDGAAIIIHNSLRFRPISIDGVTCNDFYNFKIDIFGVLLIYKKRIGLRCLNEQVNRFFLTRIKSYLLLIGKCLISYLVNLKVKI